MLNELVIGNLPQVQGVTGIADLLEFRARSHGQKEALVFGNERVTFNQLLARSKAVAQQLRSLSLVPGDKIGVYMPNGSEFVATFFGILGLGCTVVPINPLLKPEEISHILMDSDAKALIVHEHLMESAAEALSANRTVGVALVSRADNNAGTFKTKLSVKTVELNSRLDVDKFEWAQITDPQNSLAVIVYTSGTTGKPKGAMLSHRNMLSIMPGRLDLFDIDENDRCIGALPLCHIFGMTVVMIGIIAKAATLIIMPKFDAPKVLELIEKERVTILPAVPAMYQFMRAELAQGNYDISSLRICFCGAAPLPAEGLAPLEQAFGAPIFEGYALTETSCVATINQPRLKRKVGSVGPALPGVQIAIFGENGQMLPPGQDNVGEIAISGPNVMSGYYKQAESTAEVFRQGWFLSGDLGYMDEEGYLYIVGRKKEMILRGGFNVYPREVEDVIIKLPGVREVAVIGVPDERMGERVKAVVVAPGASLTEDAVKEHCAQFLADYKVPRIVEFSDMLPRNSTGKVLKRLLK